MEMVEENCRQGFLGSVLSQFREGEEAEGQPEG